MFRNILWCMIAAALFSGCVRINVEQRDSSGRVTDRTSYYPLSKKKDMKRWEGITPLHLAAFNDNSGRVKALLNEGADPFAQTLEPVYERKLTPFELAGIVESDESAAILAEHMLKHYKQRLENNEDELISILALLWKRQPLLTLELTAKYGYDKWARHTLNKLFNTKKYSTKEGKITLVRTFAHRNDANALRYLAEACPSCVQEAYEQEIANLTEVFDTRRIVGKRIRGLKYYRPYVSASAYEKAIALQQRYNDAVRRQNAQFYDMIGQAFHRAASNTSTSTGSGGDTEFEVVLKCRSYYDIKHITLIRRADGYGNGLKEWANRNGESLCRQYAPDGYSQYDGVYNIKRR